MSRHTARQRALQFLFECEMNCDNLELQREQFLSMNDKLSEDNLLLFDQLVYGVLQNKTELDEGYEAYLRKWTPERLPIVDRCILRLAIFELMQGEVPASVAISEAIQLANTFAEEDSYVYINGVLGAFARAHNYQ